MTGPAPSPAADGLAAAPRAYLDHAASSPLRPAAREAMLAAWERPGNPSSIHGHGQDARRLLEESREAIAARLGCEPIELVLTSGGTESANLAIVGGFRARQADRPRPRILATLGEHHATIEPLEALASSEGAVIEWLPIDGEGRLALDALDAALADGGEDVALMTMLLASNEVGTVQPARAAAARCREAGVPLHLDAVAALGHLPVDVRELGADLVSVSAHKLGGPVGAGALVARRSASLEPILRGGGQQRGLRPGTMDAAGAAGFAAAIAEACHPAALAAEAARLDALAERLAAGLLDVPGVTLHGAPIGSRLLDEGVETAGRAAGHVHVTVDGCLGESLLFLLDLAGVSASTGSACQAGVAEPSHVLLAMGLDEAAARSALRLTLGWSSTEAEVDAALSAFPDAVARARRAAGA